MSYDPRILTLFTKYLISKGIFNDFMIIVNKHRIDNDFFNRNPPREWLRQLGCFNSKFFNYTNIRSFSVEYMFGYASVCTVKEEKRAGTWESRLDEFYDTINPKPKKQLLRGSNKESKSAKDFSLDSFNSNNNKFSKFNTHYSNPSANIRRRSMRCRRIN